MVELFEVSSRNRKLQSEIYEFVRNQRDRDFYLTENNERLYITSPDIFNRLLKSSSRRYVYRTEDSDVTGLLLVWKSKGGNVVRNYVKLVAADTRAAAALLTILNWNFGRELYVKISKDSPLVAVFKSKGFRFEGGRGHQVLLKRGPYDPTLRPRVTEHDGHSTE